jgi:predicted hotdog family 3-hydroxylacyl-ACP dehydratase
MISNLLAVAGAASVIVATGRLAGWYWALLLAGALCFVSAYSVHTQDNPRVRPGPATRVIEPRSEDL